MASEEDSEAHIDDNIDEVFSEFECSEHGSKLGERRGGEKTVQFPVEGEELSKGGVIISEGINYVGKSQNVALEKEIVPKSKNSIVEINCGMTYSDGVWADNLICSGPVQAQLSADSWVGEILIFESSTDVAPNLGFDENERATSKEEGGGTSGRRGGERTSENVVANSPVASAVACGGARDSDDGMPLGELFMEGETGREKDDIGERGGHAKRRVMVEDVGEDDVLCAGEAEGSVEAEGAGVVDNDANAGLHAGAGVANGDGAGATEDASAVDGDVNAVARVVQGDEEEGEARRTDDMNFGTVGCIIDDKTAKRREVEGFARSGEAAFSNANVMVLSTPTAMASKIESLFASGPVGRKMTSNGGGVGVTYNLRNKSTPLDERLCKSNPLKGLRS
ncbi:hypothetical protein VNO80_22664 [Phaseolus coccineus]|uniref:Uncharacterized protein n=1 Tax=Phaseolus coccineus TaxID=3886 RepID=A0AAN9M4J4_PHACN